jgi:hypothetical protein
MIWIRVGAKRSAAQALARSGADDSALDKAETALRAAQDRVGTLTSALAQMTAELAILKAEQAAVIDNAQRADTVAKIENDALGLADAAALFDKGARAFADMADHIAIYIPDAIGLSVFCSSARSETPPALTLLGTANEQDHRTARLVAKHDREALRFVATVVVRSSSANRGRSDF